MTDIRSASGEWLGVLMCDVPSDRRYVSLAVIQPCDANLMTTVQLFFEKIELESATWQEAGIRQRIWRFTGELARLAKARHVYVRGSICATRVQ